MAAEYGRSIWETRDKEGNNGHDDLLVFGYSCKLFRDNDKALYLEKGSHLIPWMGDDSVMVDRWVLASVDGSPLSGMSVTACLRTCVCGRA